MDDKLKEIENFINSINNETSSIEALSNEDLKVPSDINLLEDLISYLYLNFKIADSKQKTKLVKLLVDVLDLKWKYLGLERSEFKVDMDKLKDALRKAGVSSPEEAIKHYLNDEETEEEDIDEEDED